MEAIFIPKTYSVQPGKDYRHFRGKTYKVLFICKDAETNEPMVVYRSQHGDYATWVRPLVNFTEFVERNGYRGPRFMEVKYGNQSR